jgi:hypothetical protein
VLQFVLESALIKIPAQAELLPITAVNQAPIARRLKSAATVALPYWNLVHINVALLLVQTIWSSVGLVILKNQQRNPMPSINAQPIMAAIARLN